ncbi:hypothetical protein BDZ88DRAFT_437824 [Geranomyces variabilis]|nr:hypothetical protein BDZ88DRAFT_437824 [Geranomyces variabilis]KAJ3133096.1 hypothetical protein HDU90_006438 [Geranomyces variabilis]
MCHEGLAGALQPAEADDVDDDYEEGLDERTADEATAGDKRALDMTDDLNLVELIEQHVAKCKRSAGHAKAYEKAEDRMLGYLRMALAERDAMVVMEDQPIAGSRRGGPCCCGSHNGEVARYGGSHGEGVSKDKKAVKNDDIVAYSAETFAASVRATLYHCTRGEESRKTKDMLSNFAKTISAIIANRGNDLNLKELIEEHGVKRKRSAGHVKTYEEAEDRMLGYLRH